MVLSKLDQFENLSLERVRGVYGLTQSKEKELNAKIDKTNKELEKAVKFIFKGPNYCLKQRV